MSDGAAGPPSGSLPDPPAGVRWPGAPVADDAPAPFHRIELLPNCSLSVRGALLFFVSVALASLTFATYFVAQGLWPVLPFAGLELAVLGWALWASMRRRHWTQMITITERDVAIATRGREGERRIVFPRHWAGVKLRRPQGWHPSRLVVESHGRACEVGGFLTEDARRALHQRLAELIGRPSESPALHTPGPHRDGTPRAGVRVLVDGGAVGPHDAVPGAGRDGRDDGLDDGLDDGNGRGRGREH